MLYTLNKMSKKQLVKSISKVCLWVLLLLFLQSCNFNISTVNFSLLAIATCLLCLALFFFSLVLFLNKKKQLDNLHNDQNDQDEHPFLEQVESHPDILSDKQELLTYLLKQVKLPLKSLADFLDLYFPMDRRKTRKNFSFAVKQLINVQLQSMKGLVYRAETALSLPMKKSELPFNLRLLTENIMTLLAPIAEKKGIGLFLRYADLQPEWLSGDPVLFQALLSELLLYSLRTTDKGYVFLEISASPGPYNPERIHFCLTDTSSADFPANEQEDSQGDDSLKEILTLAAALEGRFQGRWNEDKTRRLEFSFPCGINIMEKKRSRSRPFSRNFNLLIIANDPIEEIILNEELENWGLNPIFATSEKQALQLVMEKRGLKGGIDLIIFDSRLIQHDLTELINLVRGKQSKKTIPFIFLVNYSDIGHEISYVRLKEVYYLVRPVQSSALKSMLMDIFLNNEDEKRKLITYHHNRELQPFINVSVLIVEDNPINQQVISRVLANLGCECLLADNGQKALDLLDTGQKFDIIFMDYQMPVLNGLETTKLIRASKQAWSNLPIVGLTAFSQTVDREICLKAGMNEYIHKPIDIKDIMVVMNKYFGKEEEPLTIIEGETELEYIPHKTDDGQLMQLLNMQQFLDYVQKSQSNQRNIIYFYIGNAQEILKRIWRGLDTRDIETVREDVIQLKTLTAALGGEKVVFSAARLENALQNPKIRDLEKFADRLDSSFRELKEHLRNML